ncbi:uncharacterized protein M421DRAFT_231012 [Didymella exigua CBS 183.55]|uniref:Uncharacterized protein n=1 Tax=Didymella exigua CBS 183.55 TaxID=1150837 RepID=A0A6A5RH04_9PLEO|nr:uncharacterized protein M421DRAFT_231012 [Didymella exigua CBS 183.55]KAF1925766.1 hypothetical protein M421DRAFT_231012 [Didymella exigua CBS 183.55]
MDSTPTDKLWKDIGQFARDVDRFERTAYALQQTGSPKHLPAIKSIIQALNDQAHALARHLKAAKGLPEGQHLLLLTQDCERDSVDLLKYLKGLVASTRAAILRNSNEPTSIVLRWAPIQSLISKSRSLRAAFESSVLYTHHEDKSFIHVCLPIPLESLERSCHSDQHIGYEKRRQRRTPWAEGYDRHISSNPSDSCAIMTAEKISQLHRHALPPSTSPHDVIRQVVTRPNCHQDVKTTQIARLCNTWEGLFYRQPLSTMVLMYATQPFEIALSAPVAQLQKMARYSSMHECHQPSYNLYYEMLETSVQGGSQDIHSTLSQLPSHCSSHQAATIRANVPYPEIESPDRASCKAGYLEEDQASESLCQLASACLMVMGLADPLYGTVFQRHLMYLAHILRQDALSVDRVQQYLDAIADTMADAQSKSPTKPIMWLDVPQMMGSLPLEPELQCHSDILTFAAREALPLPLHALPAHDEARRRFAIAAHALASWSSCLPDTHADKIFEPSLHKRRSMLKYMLTHLTPPESTVYCGKFSLWKEAIRLCNSGHVKEPTVLLVTFLASSQRPDLLFEQAFQSLLEVSGRLNGLLQALRAAARDVVSPSHFLFCIGKLEHRMRMTEEMCDDEKTRGAEGSKKEMAEIEYRGW